MRIYILPVPSILQPEKQRLAYPAHNKDYGVEQDFNIWLKKQKNMTTTDPSTADWHYLPAYWTRWHINHNFAVNGEGLARLQSEIDQIMIDDAKTFTISQFDGGTLIDTGKATLFTGARTHDKGIDIPLLCTRHLKPLVQVKKKYTASFNGLFNTHPVREEMMERFKTNAEVMIGDCLPTRFFKRWFWGKEYNLNTMASYIALSPRGTSCNSFRFFEAMQLGVAPCLIGDKDVRPFKKFIPWDEISYYVATVDELNVLLKNLDKDEAIEKGKKAYQYWKNELYYQKWCKYVIKELAAIG